MKALILVSALLLAGCATVLPDSTRLEIEHVSHPLVGWPMSPSGDEDALTQANVIMHWQSGRVYVQNGFGYNLQGSDGAGFQGPGLTYTGRIGVLLWKK
jgi:hypothetical protein